MNNVIGTTANNIWTRNKTAAFRKITERTRAVSSVLRNPGQKLLEAPTRPTPSLSNDDIDFVLAFDHFGG